MQRDPHYGNGAPGYLDSGPKKVTRRMTKILIKPWSFSKSEDRVGKGITKRGNLALRVFRKMICAPIWVVIPVRHTAQGPLCGHRARLPRHLVEPCAGNEEVYRCPDGKIILIRLCVRVWWFSRDGWQLRVQGNGCC